MSKSLHSSKHRRLCVLLTEARKSQGLSQVELAKRLRRPQSFVSKYENSERRLDVVEFLEVTREIGADALAILRDLGAAG